MAPHPASIRSEVLRLLALVLRREVSSDENPSRETETDWDSLKHIELVFLIEDHFGVRFSEAEVPELADSERITRILEAKLGA